MLPLDKSRDVSVLIGGEAGAGISAAGDLLGRTLLRHGFYVFGAIDYPSLIRGGHNFYSLRVSTEPVFSQWHSYDVVVALDEKTIRLHEDKIVAGGAMIYDSDEVSVEDISHLEDVVLYPIPLTKITKELEGPIVLRNTVALGALASVVGINLETLQDGLRNTFRNKSDTIIQQNTNASQMGYDYAQREHPGRPAMPFTDQTCHGDMCLFLTGNEAIGIGALAAGCKFYSAYPMTPASGLLHFMVSHSERFGTVVMQAESEIAAINMCAGAAYAGVRCMTATSGGGFSLMTEGLGMIGMTEQPVVIMIAQRQGPSTGLPTYTSQADLRFAIHASQGEFPRLVIAPGDIEECFELTVDAFNIADRFQIPAIIMSDKHLSESHHFSKGFPVNGVHIDRGKLIPMDGFDGESPFRRYEVTLDGVSPRALPGTKGVTIHSDSAEHSEIGHFDQTSENAIAMADKRFRKMTELQKYLETYAAIKTYGNQDAKSIVVAWGSTKGAILEAQRILKAKGKDVGFLQVICLHPFPVDAVKAKMKGKNCILVETNRTGQLGGLIAEYTGLTFEHKILRYDGRPFDPLPLANQLEEVL